MDCVINSRNLDILLNTLNLIFNHYYRKPQLIIEKKNDNTDLVYIQIFK